MKWFKRIVATVAVLTVLLIIGVGGLFAWLNAGSLDVPNLSANAPSASQVFDQSYATTIDESREVMARMRSAWQAPAVSIAVAIDGEIIWAEALGYADIESLTPATLESRFAIGSVSKSISATAAASLWEEGTLDLDADIHDYVPDYPELPYPLTTRQLLSHQGGIRHYQLAMIPPVFSESGLNEAFPTTRDALQLFKDDPLLFEPDTDFAYSTFGYTLASAAMEGASGVGFLDLLQQRVFDPAGMTNTAADLRDAPAANRVSDYIWLRLVDGVLPAPETDSSYKWAGGGLVSTPTDLVRFGNALLSGDLVPEETRTVMFTPRTTADGEINPQYYGLGWRIGGLYYPRESESILTMINHGGTAIGGTAIILILPESGIVVAMTANVTPPGGSGPLRSAAADIARLFLDQMSATTD